MEYYNCSITVGIYEIYINGILGLAIPMFQFSISSSDSKHSQEARAASDTFATEIWRTPGRSVRLNRAKRQVTSDLRAVAKGKNG